MMKYILLVTVLVYIALLFMPRFKVSINGQPTDNVFYRIFGAAVFALAFFVCIGLPIFLVSLLF